MNREALEDLLDRALGWRKKELLSLRTNVALATGLEQETLVRCLVFLSYAHWEGFVKKSAQIYFDYIISQEFQYLELADNLIAAAISRRAQAPTQKVSYYGESVRFLRYEQGDRVQVKTPHDILDMGMLDSERLRSILYCLAIGESAFELKFNWIDHNLLIERNKVAHGEYLPVPFDKLQYYLDLCDETLQLIDLIHEQIIGAAAVSAYLQQPILPIAGERL